MVQISVRKPHHQSLLVLVGVRTCWGGPIGEGSLHLWMGDWLPTRWVGGALVSFRFLLSK